MSTGVARQACSRTRGGEAGDGGQAQYEKGAQAVASAPGPARIGWAFRVAPGLPACQCRESCWCAIRMQAMSRSWNVWIRVCLAALNGLLAGYAALAVAELVSAAVRPQSSPVVAVGGAAIDRTPPAVSARSHAPRNCLPPMRERTEVGSLAEHRTHPCKEIEGRRPRCAARARFRRYDGSTRSAGLRVTCSSSCREA